MCGRSTAAPFSSPAGRARAALSPIDLAFASSSWRVVTRSYLEATTMIIGHLRLVTFLVGIPRAQADDHPAAEVTLSRGKAFKTVTEQLD